MCSLVSVRHCHLLSCAQVDGRCCLCSLSLCVCLREVTVILRCVLSLHIYMCVCVRGDVVSLSVHSLYMGVKMHFVALLGKATILAQFQVECGSGCGWGCRRG